MLELFIIFWGVTLSITVGLGFLWMAWLTLRIVVGGSLHWLRYAIRWGSRGRHDKS